MSIASSPTLTDLRKTAKLSMRDAAKLLADKLGEVERSHVSILYIERDGTQKHSVIKALSEIYGVSVEDIERAIPSKNR